MRAAILALILAGPAFAQESQHEILALDAEDADECKRVKCVLVAPRAFKAMAERIQRADEYEAAARELARMIVAERKNRCA